MLKILLSFSSFFLFILSCHGQSLEVMVGQERIFTDVQWLKFVDKDQRWSVFSRTRATVDYDNNTDLFTGAYVNYTTASGIGLSLVGKMGNTGAGADTGVHIFKAKSNWMLFGLASIGLKKKFEVSWFSIFRYTPQLNDRWKIYSSLELFTLFDRRNHLVSVQRLRLGLDYRQFQFGLAVNFRELSNNWVSSANPGGFIRKSF